MSAFDEQLNTTIIAFALNEVNDCHRILFCMRKTHLFHVRDRMEFVKLDGKK